MIRACFFGFKRHIRIPVFGYTSLFLVILPKGKFSASPVDNQT